MNAIELLKKQHSEVDHLFDAIEKAGDTKRQRASFDALATTLVAHDAIEREIFYPAVERKMGLTSQLGEALAEHGLVEFCLFKAARALGTDPFEHHLAVLREVVEHHVEEEQQELFPVVKRALGVKRLELLGVKMMARYDVVRANDYRAPLRESVRQVLAGAIKTTKSTTAKSTRSRAAQAAGAAG